MATGLAIMGFGGGAIIGAPLKEALMKTYYQPPRYLGTTEEVSLTTEAGRRFAAVDGQPREVVVVGNNEIAQMLVKGPAGVYVVGTGRIGIAETFFTLGIGYFVVMLKDGVKLPISDSIRSIARDKSQGTLGDYNYEYKLAPSSLPGNNVAGNYVVYVLDGTGERDSKDFSISVPDGQGQVWIKFDQGG